jgi:hypothetical protein
MTKNIFKVKILTFFYLKIIDRLKADNLFTKTVIFVFIVITIFDISNNQKANRLNKSTLKKTDSHSPFLNYLLLILLKIWTLYML